MSLQGEIIMAFVAAVGTSVTTVCLIAHLLNDVKRELRQLKLDVKLDIAQVCAELRSVIRQPRREVRSGHHPPPPHAA